MRKSNKNMKTLLVLIGLPGSGKSTYAKEWVKEDPENRVRYNNDDFRTMILKTWENKPNQVVIESKIALLKTWMRMGLDIVVDNTNLMPYEIESYKVLVRDFPEYEVILKIIDTPLEICKERNQTRDSHMDNSFLDQAQKLLNEIKKEYDI